MDDLEAEQIRFVEEFGLLFEYAGIPRMSGRVLGWLLICDHPIQSSNDLVQALQASKASISTATRYLLQVGILERVGLPGERRDYFRVKWEVFPQLVARRAETFRVMRSLTERALRLAGDANPQREQLQVLNEFYSFFEQEFVGIVARWEERRAKANR